MSRSSQQRIALLAGMLLATPAARAQQGITLQLPTFSFFSVATTVVVPDSGGEFMGFVGRAASSQNRFAHRSSSLGTGRRAAGMHVRAQIHDLAGMDQALRGGAPASSKSSPAFPKGQPLSSLQEIERQQAAAADVQQAEAVDLFRRGNEAQAAGKSGLARTYFQMALRRASGALHEQVAAKLETIDRSAARLAGQP